MNRSIIIAACFYMVYLCGCSSDEDNHDDRIIIGEGDVVSQTVEVSSFNSIKNIGVADINIAKGDSQLVVLKAQQNILDILTYEVKNQEFVLGVEEGVSIKNSDGIIVDVTVNEITKVSLAGVGDFTLSGNKQESLVIDLIGVGNVDAYKLEVDDCFITLTGTGNCKVKVNNLLFQNPFGFYKHIIFNALIKYTNFLYLSFALKIS